MIFRSIHWYILILQPERWDNLLPFIIFVFLLLLNISIQILLLYYDGVRQVTLKIWHFWYIDYLQLKWLKKQPIQEGHLNFPLTYPFSWQNQESKEIQGQEACIDKICYFFVNLLLQQLSYFITSSQIIASFSEKL